AKRDAMAAAARRLCEEGRRLAVRIHDQVAIVDPESPVRRVHAEDFHAAADVLRGEHLESQCVAVISEWLGRLARLQGDRAGARRDVVREVPARRTAGEEDNVSEIIPDVRYLDVRDLPLPVKNVLRQAEGDAELALDCGP